MAIDFTGGTKAMSVGCALVGSLLEVDLLYVANDDYLKDLRRPRPGSERIVKISNPLQVFGDIEAQLGFDLMQEYDYRGAGWVFEKLCRSVPEPRKFEVLKLLCQAYHAWDNLDIKNAFAFMRETVERIDQYSRGRRQV
nr:MULTISPECIES: hypothetical protein [Moorella]